MGLERFLRVIQSGETVSPSTANRPLEQSHRNLLYLNDLIEAAALGSTIYARGVTVEAEAAVGMPVFYNAQTQRFERALAQVDTIEGVLVTADSSDVWGVVASKANSTLADLLLCGYATLDLSAAVDGTVTAGLYYLSGVAAGKLVRQRPPVSVAVLRSDGTKVFVNPRLVDFLDSHRHYQFPLVCAPAGSVTAPTPGERHEITDPNADWPGWLPANHAIFEGYAPAGAAFGYNLSAHDVLQAAWPPLPLAGAYLEWDRGTDPDQGAQGVPLGSGGLCQIDQHGIWWMSDCYGDVPWPATLTTEGQYSESVFVENSPPECPRDVHMALTLWFTKINFYTDATVVTSLRSLDDRLIITCAGTATTGAVGDLEITLDLKLVSEGDTDRAWFAMKTLAEDGKTIARGPIASGVYATTDNVVLVSEYQTLVDPEDETSATLHHGAVGVGVRSAATQELSVSLVSLNGATEENTPVLYIGFSNDVVRQMTGLVEVPADAPTGATLKYRMRILGRGAGTLPQLTVEYFKSSRPADGLNEPVSVIESFAALEIETVAELSGVNQAVEAESEAFAVDPGDLVYIRVTRDPDDENDQYASELGIMQHVGILVAAS